MPWKPDTTAFFVDRDGTICFDEHHISDQSGFDLIPTVAEEIRRLNDAGISITVVTSPSDMARG